MTRPLSLLALSAAILIACDSNGAIISTGIASLGADFVRAFNLAPNDVPLNAQDVRLTLTPLIEPFNP